MSDQVPAPENEGVKAIRKALKKAKSADRFQNGDFVKWTSSDRYNYGALRTPVGWCTTALPGNPFVAQRLTFEELLEILSRPETSKVFVAASWTALSEDAEGVNGI